MFLLNFVADAAPIQTKELPDMVPGKLDWDYIGSSFSDFSDFAVDAENGVGRWVQNFVGEIEVTPDGTVIVGCYWDEGGRCLGLYKDGRPSGAALGKNDRKGGHRNGGWGTSTSAMTAVGNEILCNYAINAMKRKNGEYILFAEDYGAQKVNLFRWKP